MVEGQRADGPGVQGIEARQLLGIVEGPLGAGLVRHVQQVEQGLALAVGGEGGAQQHG